MITPEDTETAKALNAETIITLTRKELVVLLSKLDIPFSAKALLRQGENGLHYYIKAIEDDESNGKWEMHPNVRDQVKAYYEQQ